MRLTMADLLQQVFNGLVSGSFYALLALGLAVIFGMLGVVNFAHGAFYMLGAFGAYILLDRGRRAASGSRCWWCRSVLGVLGMVLERLLDPPAGAARPAVQLPAHLRAHADPAGPGKPGVRRRSPSRTRRRPALSGSVDLGLFDYPAYQVFVLGVLGRCCASLVWWLLTRTRVGMVVRAATERPELTRALGIDVGRWVTPVFGFGIALAGLAGVLAAPMRAVNPLMGADLIIVVFAVVVIGGLGSIFGSVAAGFADRHAAGAGQPVRARRCRQTLVFILMAVVLLWRPAGLFGREEAVSA